MQRPRGGTREGAGRKPLDESSPTKRLTVLVSTRQLKVLSDHAEKHETTRSELVRGFIDSLE